MNIFISYSRANRGTIDELAARVEAMGHTIWFDHALTGGRDRWKWWDKILDNIERCDLLIFALTPRSLHSYQCTLENGYAIQLNKHGLILMLEDTEKSLLPYRTRQLPLVDYRQQNIQRDLDLKHVFNSLPPVQPLPDSLTRLRPMPPPSRGELRYVSVQVRATPKLSYYMQKSLLSSLKSWLDNGVLAEIAWYLLAALHDRNDLQARCRVEIEALFGPDKIPDLVMRLEPSPRDYNRMVVALSPDGRFVATGSYDSAARLWDAVSGKELRWFAGHQDCVTSLAFSPDGRHLLVAGGDKAVRLLEVTTGQELQQFIGHSYSAFGVAFSLDGRYILTCTTGGSLDRVARLWDVTTGVELRQFPADVNGVFSVTFSPDGHQVLTGNYNVARLWDTETVTELHQFAGHANGVTSVVFSADGHYILTTSYMTVRLWDAVTREELRQFVDGNIIDSAIFSNDNHYVLTAGSKGARLWDVATGRELREFVWLTDYVTSATISSDGKRLLTGSENGIVRAWKTGIT